MYMYIHVHVHVHACAIDEAITVHVTHVYTVHVAPPMKVVPLEVIHIVLCLLCAREGVYTSSRQLSNVELYPSYEKHVIYYS